VDEAVAFSEGPGGRVAAVARGAVQGLGLHDADPVGAQVVQDVAEQGGSVPAAAPGRIDGDPQYLRAAGRPGQLLERGYDLIAGASK
jgi:hypothetical protein